MRNVSLLHAVNYGRSAPHRMQGFTLLEIAISLVVIGLLISSLLGPIQTQMEARDRRDTEARLNLALEALYGFAIANGRLPCPDTDGDGAADSTDVNGELCDGGTTYSFTDGDGFLPWSDLGIPPGDAWRNHIRYRVTFPDYTRADSDGLCDGNVNPNEFDLCAVGGLVVRSRGDDPATAAIEGKAIMPLATNVPAVLFSHGRNGYGARSLDGVARATPPGSTDESRNADAGSAGVDFYARSYSIGAAGCSEDVSSPDESKPLCEFDDLLVWVSPTVLVGKMVTAGRLP